MEISYHRIILQLKKVFDITDNKVILKKGGKPVDIDCFHDWKFACNKYISEATEKSEIGFGNPDDYATRKFREQEDNSEKQKAFHKLCYDSLVDKFDTVAKKK